MSDRVNVETDRYHSEQERNTPSGIVKLCKDCAYARPFEQKILFWRLKDISISRCAHKSAERIDLVTGELDPKFCSAMRVMICGPEGKWFEPKVPA